MITISLCMIVKNEEEVLERCLSSVSTLMDEIIIVDTGSQDKTKDIASHFTSHIYDFEWIDDFSAARNYSYSLASCDYCMWLDADDIITDEDVHRLKLLKESLEEDIGVVMARYNTGFDDNGNVTFSYYRERITKNTPAMFWTGAVHEVIQPIGKLFYTDFAITHKKLHTADPDRNLRIFESQLEKGISLDLRQQFYYGRELYYHKQYEKAISIFRDFLANNSGWLENRIDACCHIAYCYYEIGKDDDALMFLLKTLSLDLPRAEPCCDIGRHFFNKEDWRKAAFWYSIATTCTRDDSRGGFSSPDCYGYIPCIQLCVCYSQLGELKKAVFFNELAASYKPDSKAVEHNRVYFNSL